MDNKNYTQEIIEQLSHLRDLLIVIERGGDKTPDILYTLAIEKSQQITSLVNEWRDEVQPEAVTVPEEYAVWIDGKTQEDIELDTHDDNDDDSGVEAAAENEAIEIPESFALEFSVEEMELVEECKSKDSSMGDEEAADEEKSAFTFALEEEPAVSVDNAPKVQQEQGNITFESETVAEEAPENIEVPENVSLMTDDIGVMEETDEIYTDEVEETDAVVVDDEFIGVVDDDFVEDADEDIVAADDELEDDLYNKGEPSDSGVITIGEKMSMHRAKELRKALSLNDRFRFRRELFGNKDVEMNNTLNLIDAMNDYAEAREYLLQDLGWSYEEPVVQEFMELVERHFKQ